MTSLLDFLKKRKEESLSFESMKQEWIRTLDNLFQQIEGWLEEPKRLGLIDVKRSQLELHEEDLGVYQAPMLLLSFHEITKEIIAIKPIARRIVGASGRVDFLSKTKSYIAIHRNGKWLFSRDKTILVDFTKESFEAGIQDMLSTND